ncbi:MAG TPA: CidA/LrgA family protein [Pseudomonas sp.]|uniref:CidA/LrgA family protein n=1 Tax=Pseudomonas sp. TaxID=306 RepID=UPI002ED933EA
MKRLQYLARLVLELLALLAIYQLGCEIAMWFNWPIPGGVIGLALLLLAFASGLIKPASLQLASSLLVAEMLLFFIPPLMSLLDYGALVRHDGWRIMLVIGLSTFTVMLVTAFTVETVCRWKERPKEGRS